MKVKRTFEGGIETKIRPISDCTACSACNRVCGEVSITRLPRIGNPSAAGIAKRSGIGTCNSGSLGRPPGCARGSSISVPKRNHGARADAMQRDSSIMLQPG